MTFAIFYNPADLQPLADATVATNLWNQTDKRLAQAVRQGGLSEWETAPQAPVEYQSGDPNTRIVVIDARVQGQPVTLQEFRDLLYRHAHDSPVHLILEALADDMARHDGAKEPWP